VALWFVAPNENLRVMNVRCEGDTATIQFTSVGLSLLVNAFESWLGGGEDFGVSPLHSSRKRSELGTLDHESGEVWFWGPGYVGP
jgi:hypothetical protein